MCDGLGPDNQESVVPEIVIECLESHRGVVDGTNMHETWSKVVSGMLRTKQLVVV